VLLAHIHAAYHQLQVSLTTLAHNTKSQEYRENIGAAQKDLDRWRIQHWSHIITAEKSNGKSQIKYN